MVNVFFVHSIAFQHSNTQADIQSVKLLSIHGQFLHIDVIALRAKSCSSGCTAVQELQQHSL